MRSLVYKGIIKNMFTGIITHLGRVESITKPSDTRIKISAENLPLLGLGASIACSGICLTVVNSGQNYFEADVSEETINCTNFRDLKTGSLINLEPSLKIGDELGGHFVTGHIDDVAKVLSIKSLDGSHVFEFSIPEDLGKYIARKGSITINGVSLTVNEVEKNSFFVNIIPHSFEVTNFCDLKIGNLVNLEIDILARYLDRMNNV
jgi:riboflavin synthase